MHRLLPVLKRKTLRHAHQMRRRETAPSASRLSAKPHRETSRPTLFHLFRPHVRFFPPAAMHSGMKASLRSPSAVCFSLVNFGISFRYASARFYRPFFLFHGMKYPFLANGAAVRTLPSAALSFVCYYFISFAEIVQVVIWNKGCTFLCNSNCSQAMENSKVFPIMQETPLDNQEGFHSSAPCRT